MVKGKMPKTDTAETSSSTEIEFIDDFKRVNESIKEISSMIDNLKPKGTFETQVKLVLHCKTNFTCVSKVPFGFKLSIILSILLRVC